MEEIKLPSKDNRASCKMGAKMAAFVFHVFLKMHKIKGRRSVSLGILVLCQKCVLKAFSCWERDGFIRVDLTRCLLQFFTVVNAALEIPRHR